MSKLSRSTLQTYISWTSLSIAFLFSVIIILRDKFHRYTTNESPPKYLQIWSSICLYISPLCIILFLSRKIPYICLWTYPLSAASLIWPYIFLTFFEIARLKLCFAANKIPKELAYPNWLFTISYLIGFILLIVTASYWYFTTTIYSLDNNLGCIFDKNALWSLVATSVVLTVTIWNWIVVLLYVIKLYQFKKMIIGETPTQNQNESTREVIERINLVLTKMLFLILTIQITTNIVGLTSIWFDAQIGWMLDRMACVGAMYLMLEHNQKDYYKFIGCCIKIRCIKCCCCCLMKLIEEDRINEINEEMKDSDSSEIEDETTTNHRVHVLNIKPNEDAVGKGGCGGLYDSERTSIVLMKYVDETGDDTKTLEMQTKDEQSIHV